MNDKPQIGTVDLAKLEEALSTEGDDPKPREPRPPSTARLKAVLAERRDTHGEFTVHASITQGLKDFMRSCKGWERLSVIQREALEMNAHKIGRILAGNPDFKDHWTDIAGYAQLVADRLS